MATYVVRTLKSGLKKVKVMVRRKAAANLLFGKRWPSISARSPKLEIIWRIGKLANFPRTTQRADESRYALGSVKSGEIRRSLHRDRSVPLTLLGLV